LTLISIDRVAFGQRLELEPVDLLQCAPPRHRLGQFDYLAFPGEDLVQVVGGHPKVHFELLGDSAGTARAIDQSAQDPPAKGVVQRAEHPVKRCIRASFA
jgi:hypothetical protein